MQGFRASEWGNEGFLKDDGKDGLGPESLTDAELISILFCFIFLG
jgi:hypothetical protein